MLEKAGSLRGAGLFHVGPKRGGELKRLFFGLVLSLALAAPASAMSVAEFLTKADALKARGAMALFSGDLKLLMREVKAAGQGVRTDNKRRQQAGLAPRSCPPERVSMKSDELLAALRTIPPGDRGISVQEGFARMMAARYPCG